MRPFNKPIFSANVVQSLGFLSSILAVKLKQKKLSRPTMDIYQKNPKDK